MAQQALTTNTTTAATYERVSTLIQGRHGYSLSAQEKDDRQFCADRGWHLPDDLRFVDGEDRNASGKDWDLPGLNRMLDAAKAGRFQVLVVPNTGRFARNMVKAKVLEEQLGKYGVRVVYRSIPIEDDTAEARLLKNQLQAFDEYERELIAFRTWRGRRAKAEKGEYVGSEPCPYGYQFVRGVERNGRRRVSGIEPNPSTAPAVQTMFDLAARVGVPQVARAIEAAGYLTPRGNAHWTCCTIRQILRNPLYKGIKTWGRDWSKTEGGNRRRGDLLTGSMVNVPPLVDENVWEAVQRGLVERYSHKIRPARKRTEFELRGILLCGSCGGLLTCRVIPPRYRFYQCGCHRPSDAEKLGKPVCPLPAVPARVIEEHVKERVTALFLDPLRLESLIRAGQEKHSAADQSRQERLDILAKEISTRRKRLDRTTAELLDVDEDSEAYASLKRTQATLSKEIEKYKAEQKALESQRPGGISAAQALTLREAAERVKANIEAATSETMQEIYSLLDLRGTVRLDPESGLTMGKYQFTIEWNFSLDTHSNDRILL
jgi:DNA invertase Pin-like site-specific DNA recombinase